MINAFALIAHSLALSIEFKNNCKLGIAWNSFFLLFNLVCIYGKLNDQL